MSGWVYRRGNSPLIIVSSDDNTTTYYGFWFAVNPVNTFSVNIGDGTGRGEPDRRSKDSSIAVRSDSWVHVAAVVRGPTDMSLYIDGADAGGAHSGSGGPMVHSASPFRLGLRTVTDAHYADGVIDDVRIYDRTLTPEEIQALASMGD